MKKLALAALVAVTGSAAVASGYIEPYVEPEVVVTHSSSSVGGVVVPLLLLVLVAALAS